MNEPGRHRYPGPESFRDSDLDRVLFHGRDAEGARLLHLTLAEEIVVLYAKSGAGKTSLINTRLLKPLRERQFLPVVARVGDPRLTPAAAICDAVRDAAGAQGFEVRDGDRSSLFAYFRTLEVWHRDVLLTPVVILDQFEELFTVRTPEVREAFGRELAALRGRADPGPGVEEGRVPLKLVLSLREDSIGELEELSACMPDVLQHRFRIGPLSEADAVAAIVEPAKLVDPALANPPFAWDDLAVERLIAFLHRRNVAGRTFTSNQVELFQLQLICRHVEELVAARQAAGQPLTRIDYDRDIGGDAGARRIIRGFYEQQLAALAREYPIRRLQRLCEEGLITSAGRRAILDEATIAERYGLDAAALEALSMRRLIRAEPRGDEKRYELSHDALVAPIVEVRNARKARRNRKAVVGSAAAVALLAGSAFFVVRSDWFQERQAVREGSRIARDLLGGSDNLISTWSVALGWGGYGDQAQAEAREIEQPSTQVIALTRLAQALAALDERGNRALVEQAFSNAAGTATRLPQSAERTELLAEVGLRAEALKLTKVAEAVWQGLRRDSDTWLFLIDGADVLRRSGVPTTPGFDAVLREAYDNVVTALRSKASASGPFDSQTEDLVRASGTLFRVVAGTDLEPLAVALDDVLARRLTVPERVQASVFLAIPLVERGLTGRALQFVSSAERQLDSITDADSRLMSLAVIARLLDLCGESTRASVAAHRLRASLNAGLHPGALLEALDVLEGRKLAKDDAGPRKQPSADLVDASKAIRQVLRRPRTDPSAGPDVLDLLRLGEVAAARALLKQLSTNPSVDKREFILPFWRAGDQETARAIALSLPQDEQPAALLDLAALAEGQGRPDFEHGSIAAQAIQDPQLRGVALAGVVNWISLFAPEELERVFTLVHAEADRLAREPMLRALVVAAGNPMLAERVARFVVAEPLPPAELPPATAAESGTQADAEESAADVINSLVRERLVRLQVFEAALWAAAGSQAGGLIPDVFAAARTEAGRLGGRLRVEWLTRLGVLAASTGQFAEARRLAAEFGDNEREGHLTVLTAIVAARAARRAPNFRDRIYDELLPSPTGGGGGGF